MALNTKEILDKNNEILTTTGLTFHRLVSPSDWGDFTTNRSLYGYEVDRNFYNLKAQDIKTATFDEKNSTLIINRYNGEKICVKITGAGGGAVTKADLEKVKKDLTNLINSTAAQLRKENQQMKVDLEKTIDEKVKNVHCDCDMEMAKLSADLNKKIDNVNNSVTKINTQIKNINSDITNLKTSVKDINSTVTTLSAKTNTLETKTTVIQNDVTKLKNTTASLSSTTSTLVTKTNSLQKEVNNLKSATTIISATTNTLETKTTQIQKDTKQLKTDVTEIENNINILSGDTEVIKQEIKQALYYSGDDLD